MPAKDRHARISPHHRAAKRTRTVRFVMLSMRFPLLARFTLGYLLKRQVFPRPAEFGCCK
jgi:hypothetical protein